VRALPIQKAAGNAKRQIHLFFSRAGVVSAIAFSAPAHHISRMNSARMMNELEVKEAAPKPRRIEMFGRGFNLPQSRWQRIALGIALMLGGLLWFLPILGIWMIPLGLFVLSLELASVRRLRRRLIVRFSKRREKTG
jgi:hypothetical protein